MKNLLALVFLLIANPLMAAEAIFADGVLKLDAVRVGADVYAVELVASPDSNPMTFTLASARKLSGVTDVAATFSGTALTVSNVLVNGTRRFNAQLALAGSNPYRFRLATYSLLRGVALALEGQTMAPDQFLTLSYTGAVLDKQKVKLTAGGVELPATVIDNTVVASVPNIAGTTSLQVDLDGAKFAFPLTVGGTVPLANPRSYVSTFANDLDAMLRQAQLPSTLFDRTVVENELAKLSDNDARRLAEQLRANLGPLLQSVTATNGLSGQALRFFTSNEELGKWCVVTGKLYLTKVKQVAIAGVATLYFAEAGQPVGALISAAAMGALAGGALGTRSEAMNFGCYDVSPFSNWNRIYELYDSVTLAQELEFFEDRPQAYELTEVRDVLGGEFAGLYLEASKTLVDIAKKVKNTILMVPFISNSSAVIGYMDSVITTINVDGVERVANRASKYRVKSVSDSRISADMMTLSGSTIFIFNQIVGDIPAGQSIRFTLELYNEEDDVTMKVPILLRGASMLEDLKAAALGRWTVTAYEGAVVIDLELRPGGKGAYLLPLVPEDIRTSEGGYCKKNGYPPGMSGKQVGNTCEYPLTWSISQQGNAYEFTESGLWLHDGCCVITKQALSLPLTRIVTYGNGTPLRTYVRK